MGYGVRVGRYQVGKTIGEGTFAKVKMAVDTENGKSVAIKVLDKKMVVENRLMQQVKREISAMKLLHHPNIVRIHEVIATKTKIYIVMEYVSGGSSRRRCMSEKEARRYFQQLIDAVDYCHARGIYHRDLKPENLLIDSKGNLKVSDFGLSALRKPGDMLSTACGSPSYVAPEVIIHKKYEGAAADIWSCGVILFELLAGFLPLRTIAKAEYKCPEWFAATHRKLLSRILEPMPRRRAKVAEILEDEWFRVGYEPAAGILSETTAGLENIYEPLDGGKPAEATKTRSPSFINAFQLIAMSNDLDLSGLFEEQDDEQQKTKLCSKHPVSETIEKIQVAAMDASLSVERMNGSKVIEVTPTHCMIEISRSAGEIRVYKEFCKSLSEKLETSAGSRHLAR
ncbi:unnamed protein product [Spirodela intermedia]|uniref:non-specific serine/threonine protein kinase n=1 Tax=Spirodela intermedia TaxID=51605 RepID=A0A7I8IWV1_SPIIN|nr:unnamed protein product [Spirodela intermedia]CAA6662300.1 unnamed protein product [Spirodela intermedia]